MYATAEHNQTSTCALNTSTTRLRTSLERATNRFTTVLRLVGDPWDYLVSTVYCYTLLKWQMVWPPTDVSFPGTKARVLIF